MLLRPKHSHHFFLSYCQFIYKYYISCNIFLKDIFQFYLKGVLVCSFIRIVLLQVIQSGILEGKGQPRFTTGKWNPHHGCSQFVTANDGHVRSWDLRVPSVHSAWTVENAHSQLVRWWQMHTFCFLWCSFLCDGEAYIDLIMWQFLNIMYLINSCKEEVLNTSKLYICVFKRLFHVYVISGIGTFVLSVPDLFCHKSWFMMFWNTAVYEWCMLFLWPWF